MSNTTIHQVIGIGGTTLIVFYTAAHCWQFRLISPGGAVIWGAQDILHLRSGSEGRVGVDCSGELAVSSLIINAIFNIAKR